LKREFVIYMALAAVAFSVTRGYVMHTRAERADLQVPRAETQAATDARPAQPAGNWSLAGSDPEVPAHSAGGPSTVSGAAAVRAVGLPYAPAAGVSEPVIATPIVAQAESFVVDYSSPANTLRTAERAAQFDDRAEDRIAAVTTLRQLAYGGNASPSVLEAIRTATVDADPAVASAAQAAYDEVQSLQSRQRR
jgi:hypothetical protein